MSRVLGVANIGICNFVDSVISYFMLFSLMGLSISGIREIATAKSDKMKLSQTFSSLVTLSGIATLVATVVLLVCIQVVPKFAEHSRLMYIGVMKLVFNFFLIEWFYKGMEDFKYITVRSVLIKAIYVISIFIFVKHQEDYWIYFLLSTLIVVFNAVVNIIHSRKYISFSFESVRLRPFLPAFFIMGVYLLTTSLYTTFNTFYLGMVSTDVEVGYYATAHKLYMVIIALYTAFTGVMMPRMSSLLSDGKIEEFKKYINKSVEVLFTVAIPVIISSCIFSKEIVRVLSGEGYDGAVLPMQIMMPLILIVGYEQVLIVQTLMPLKKDKIIFRNSLIGAVIGILLNIILVGRFAAIGSSIVWLCCEIVILILAQVCVQRIINIRFPLKSLFVNVLLNLPLFAVCLLVHRYGHNPFVTLTVGASFAALYFVMVQLFIVKDSVVSSMIKGMLKKITESCG